MKIGAIYKGNNECEFIVWATKPNSVAVKIVEPFQRTIRMEKNEFDYWMAKADDVPAGAKYFYSLNDSEDRPDPASNYQPYDVHSASEVVDHSKYKWNDKNWKGVKLEDLIIYELHIGTYTDEGTFESAISRLDELNELGITAIEIMPVSQFAGTRNWGYDGCYPFAPQNSYGGPEGLKKLVDAAHKNGIAVILDVVYNHFGPEGNYTSLFSDYFTHKYLTPWGDAINFDDANCEGVRNYFLENAKYWLKKYHIDGLRLDAIETIHDLSTKHFLQELSEEIKKLSNEIGINKFLIAESDLNDIKIIKPISEGGYGLDAQWSDDFHHSVHALLTGERNGYYIDYGSTADLIEAVKNTFVYDGKYSKFRKRKHGNSALERPPNQFVIFLQNHDQVGNRPFGKRLTKLISFEALKAAAGILFLSPGIPLLFMGEEYGEENPFLYFVSHADEYLIEAVQKGRIEEFSLFEWKGVIPDPFSEHTFIQSKLNHQLQNEEKHKVLLHFYRHLITLKKTLPALKINDRKNYSVSGAGVDKVIQLHRWSGTQNLFCVFNFNEEAATTIINFPEGSWNKIFDSASEKWMGSGESAAVNIIGKPQNLTLKKYSFCIFEME